MVREGYKQTEVGEIPEAWDVTSLGDYVVIASGESPSKFKLVSSGIPYFKVEQLNNDRKYLRATPYYFDKGKTVPRGSVIFPKRGASILLNKIRIVAEDCFMDTNLMALTVNGGLSEEYLFYCLHYLGLEKVADTTSIPQINNKHITPFKIPFPEELEQLKISKALSDVDDLIASLEKLIAKKRDIKTATMQQLLTGKKRLPGFGEGKGYKQTELGEIPEDWDVVELGSAANIQMGQSPSSSNYNTKGKGLALVQGNADIDKRKTIIRNYTTQITKKAYLGDIILSVRAPVGEVAIADADCCIGRGVCSIKYKNDYLYHWLVYFEPFWEKFSKGSTFDSINSDELKKVTLLLPKQEREQVEVASVITALEEEIESLESRLSKIGYIKQGMMQELLTGRTRLVDVNAVEQNEEERLNGT